MPDHFPVVSTKTVKKDVWSEDEDFPRSAWKRDVADGNTNLGYWDWVNSQISQRLDEAGKA
jgi:hypothetical protein